MQNRRQFLKTAGLFTAGSLVAPQLLSSCSVGQKNIGLQLYSLRGMIHQEGIDAVLKAVADIGYTNLETANYRDGLIYGMKPSAFKSRVEALGMKCTSAHLSQGYDQEREKEIMDWWKTATDAHAEVGAKYMIMPSMPVNENSPLEDLQRYCEYFNKVGEITDKAGIRFGFHNHAGEFRKIGEQVIYDYMLAHTNQDVMGFQLDVYWCQVGGADPVEYLINYPDQMMLTHIKDEKEIGESGMMDFEAIFNQMKKNKITDWYVEVERYSNDDDLASVRESFEYLNNAAYVK